MRFLFLIIFFNIVAYIYSQEKELEISINSLDTGAYDICKVKNNTLKVLYGKEALAALEKQIAVDKELKDYIGGYMEEQDIISYYPQEGIALFECPAKTVSVFDLNNKEDSYGDPATYIYSPSGKYRFSSLEADGVHYYLEERENEKYVYLGLVFPFYISQNLSGFYWEDDKTLHYLKECHKDDSTTYKKAYSVSFLF